MLIDDGSAIRPPIGSVTLRNVPKRPEAEGEAGLPVAVRHGQEAGAEVLAVERAAPDRHGQPRVRELVEDDPELRQRVEDHEDLDEDRRVPDHLDVDGRELADDRDPVGARGAEHEPDREGADDRDRRHLERVEEPVQELLAVLGDERPEVVGREHHRGGDNEEAAARARPLPASDGAVARSQQTVSALGEPGGGVRERVVRPQDALREAGHEPGRDVVLEDRQELSFCFISVEARVDPALHRDVPLLDPDPVRRLRGRRRR